MCMRIGPRFNKQCANISIQDSQELNWVKSCRYLGIAVDIGSASHFKCKIREAKNCFSARLTQSFVELVALRTKMLQ